MGVVEVNGIRVHAFHGCIDEEGWVGGEFEINIRVHAPFSKVATSDNLDEAIDYVQITEIAKKEMAIRARLIETVAVRIIKSIQKKYPKATKVEVKLTKHRAPIEADVRSVSVYVSNKDV